MLHRLFLDECGNTNMPPTANAVRSPYFVFTGISIKVDQIERLKILADQIKFRFWKRTNIIFHSRGIGLRSGDFSILKDPQVEIDFYKCLINFLDQSGIKIIAALVDKQKADVLKWNKKDIYEKSSEFIIRFFIEFLANRKERGQIIVESSEEGKDVLFYKKYLYYRAAGIPSLGINAKKVENLMTSVSFVSKNNHDIGEQIADLISYAIYFKARVEKGEKIMIPNSYEDKMCKIFDSKIIEVNSKKSFIKLP